MSGALLPLISTVASVLNPNPDWRARMRRASFRGVPFYVESADSDYGRRYVMHQYPGRDLPYAEDLGRKQREWSVRAYTVGSLFLMEREALVRACEAPGPGRFIHPMLGSFDAVCTACTFIDSRDRGGFSALNLAFAEAGELRKPEATADTETALESGARGLDGGMLGSFLGSFNVGGADSILGPLAATAVSGIADRFDGMRLGSFGIDQGTLMGAIDILRRGASTLVFNPTELFSRTSDVFSAFTESHNAGFGLSSMLSFFGGGAVQQPAAAATLMGRATARASALPMPQVRRDEVVNARALEALQERLALREIAYLLPGLDLDNTAQAITTRAHIVAAFDEASDVAADLGEDDTFAALITLRARVLTYMDTTIAQLPALVRYQTPLPKNALTLAWALYQDANRDLELVARVNAPTPLWMPTAGMVLNR